MKLRNLKYALLLTTVLGASDGFAALSATDIQADNTAHAITGGAVLIASVDGTTYGGVLTSAGGAEAVAFLDTTNEITFSSTIGATGANNNVILDIVNDATVNLSNATTFWPTSGDAVGALRVHGAATLIFPLTVPVFDTTAYTEIFNNTTMEFGADALDFTSPIYIAPGCTLTLQMTTAGHDVTLSGIISGGGNLIWAGDTGSVLTLSAANTLIGNIIVTGAGTISHTSNISGSAIAINGARALFTPTTTTTFGAITAVADTVNYTEAVAVLDSSFSSTDTAVFASNSFGTADNNVVLSVEGSGTVQLGGAGAQVFYGSATGGSLRLIGSPIIEFPSSIPAFTANTAGDSSYIDVLSDSTLDFGTLTGTLAAAIVIEKGKTLTVNVDAGATATLSGIISGEGNLVMTGVGTLKLTGVNTYTGTTTRSGTGTLYLTPLALSENQTYATALAIPSGVVQPFNVTSGTATISSILSGAGSIQKLGSGILQLSAANTFTGKIYVGDGSAAAGRLAVLNAAGLGSGTEAIVVAASSAATLMNGTAAAALTFSTSRPLQLSAALAVSVPHSASVMNLNGVVSGAFAVTKQDAGRLNLGAVNTYTGGTTFSAGIIGLTYVSGLGTGTLTSSNDTTVYLPTGANGVNTMTNALTLGGVTTFNSAAVADNITLSGAITGAGTFKKAGVGAVTLSSTGNTITGGVQLGGGTVKIGAAGALSTAAASTVTVLSSSTLEWTGTYALTAGQDIAINSGAALSLNVPAGYNGTIAGDISGAGTWTKLGAGNLTVTPASGNSQSGNMTHSAGKVTFGGTGNIFGTGSDVMAVGTVITTNGASRTIEAVTAINFAVS